MTKLKSPVLFAVAAFIAVGIAVPSAVYAANGQNKINLVQKINEGGLAVGTVDPTDPTGGVTDGADLNVAFGDKTSSTTEQTSTKEADKPLVIDNASAANKIKVTLSADADTWADGAKTMGYDGANGLLTGTLAPANKSGVAIAGTALNGTFTFNGVAKDTPITIGTEYEGAAYSKIELGKYTFDQTIPAGQAAGTYKLALTQTVVIVE